MNATQVLPASYRKIGTLDVSQNTRLLLIFNVVALVIMAIAGFLFFQAMFRLRSGPPFDGQQLLQVTGLSETVGLIAAVLGLTALHIVIHEAIHGVFFWIFTHSRPLFAFRWTYAYAAAPDWFIPRNPFLVTTLAPLILITLGGLILFKFAPVAWVLPTWFIITMNAGGAVGDMAVAGWLVRQPPTCLAQDRGDAVTLYLPETS